MAPWGIEIGNDVYVAGGCWLSGGGHLKIEDEVICGPYSMIITANHVFINNSARFGGFARDTVTIGRGTWIASHVTILPGVSIGSGNLIAAGAVVTKNTEDNIKVGGVPAKVIGIRQDDSLKEKPF